MLGTQYPLTNVKDISPGRTPRRDLFLGRAMTIVRPGQRWQEVQECQFDIRSITGAVATREPLDTTKVRRALPPASLEGSVLNLDGTRDPFEYATARRLHHCS